MSKNIKRQRLMGRVSIHDLRQRIARLRRADMRFFSQEAVTARVARIIDQYPLQIRPWMVSGVYRARVNKPGVLFTSAGELWYPPQPNFVRNPGRLNKPGQVLFYAANMPNVAALELRVKPGDMVTVLVARTHSGNPVELRSAFVGLERSLAPEANALGSSDMFRTSPRFRKELGEGNYKKWLLIDDYLSEVCGTAVPDDEPHLYYPTIALSELLFRAPNVDAIQYPSVATQDHGINVCMLPARADAVFRASEAWMIQIGEKEPQPETGQPLMRIRFRLRSHEIGHDGVINWRAEGDGIDQETIMGFVRQRMERLDRWPTKE
jgi:hypothetical protein